MLAMKKGPKNGCLLGIFVGNELLPRYMGIIS